MSRTVLALLALAAVVAGERVFGSVMSLPAALAAFALGLVAAPPVVVAGVLATAGGLTAAAASSRYTAADDFVFYAVLVVGMPAALGMLVATRRRRTAALRERAARLAAERDRRAAVAELEERLRLNAELETAIAARAERIAALATAAGRGALSAIEDAARGILADIRDVLGLLRAVPAPPETAKVPPAATPPARADAALALALLVALAVEAAGSAHRSGGVPVNAAAIALVTLPLAWRRRAPLPACAASCAGLLAMDLVATPVSPLVTPAALLGLLPYTLGAHLARRPAVAALGAVLAFGALLQLTAPATADSSLVALSVVELLAWAAGRWVRAHDDGVRAAADEADRRATERDEAAHLAVLRERARTARELHDVTAHAMTAIVLQAGAAQRVWDDDPSAAQAALAAIARLAADVRRDEGSDLQALAADARANGLDVDLDATVAPGAVGYRTVQEALTNAARHAAGARVVVRVHEDGDRLLIEVVDGGGTPAGIEGTGHGLRGMRERVEACGGRLETGALPEGGFAVRATLPR